MVHVNWGWLNDKWFALCDARVILSSTHHKRMWSPKYINCVHWHIHKLSLGLFCLRLSASVGSRCFARGVVFRALELLQVSGSGLCVKRTQNTSTLSGICRVFTADRSLLFYFYFFPNHPDYRLSGPARIPFLTHQNGDIHLKDDICGEFPNSLIVIRRRRGQRGRYDGGE